jgi:hypothetical protein
MPERFRPSLIRFAVLMNRRFAPKAGLGQLFDRTQASVDNSTPHAAAVRLMRIEIEPAITVQRASFFGGGRRRLISCFRGCRECFCLEIVVGPDSRSRTQEARDPCPELQ